MAKKSWSRRPHTWTLAESGPLAPASDQASLDAGTAAAGGGNAPAAAGEGAVAAAIAARAATLLALASQVPGADGSAAFAVTGNKVITPYGAIDIFFLLFAVSQWAISCCLSWHARPLVSAGCAAGALSIGWPR